MTSGIRIYRNTWHDENIKFVDVRTLIDRISILCWFGATFQLGDSTAAIAAVTLWSGDIITLTHGVNGSSSVENSLIVNITPYDWLLSMIIHRGLIYSLINI